MTKEELQSTYSKLSNQELLEIIDRKFEYTELAITVAFEEISKRNISEEDISNYKTEQVEKAVKFVKKNIVDDLSLLQKNFFFFIWIPIINFPFKNNFIDDGYVLKLKQAQYYSLTGFIFFVIIVIVSEVYALTTLTTIAFLLLSFLLPYSFDEFFNRKRQIEKMRRIFKDENSESAE
ncbi:MAG TPA: hypothetical protein DIW54_01995 [Chitinophagaceae bacterium]|nr:hypothetical protein [Chitinophagaceae bacterium]